MSDESRKSLWEEQRETFVTNLAKVLADCGDPSAEMLGTIVNIPLVPKPYALCQQHRHFQLMKDLMERAQPTFAGLFNGTHQVVVSVWLVSEGQEKASSKRSRKIIQNMAASDIAPATEEEAMPVFVPPKPFYESVE